MGYTIKRLILEPKEAIEEYLFEDRNKLTKPFQLIVLLVAIATFLTFMVLPDLNKMIADLHETPGWKDFNPAVQKSLEWFTTNMQQYFNVFFLGGIPFISLSSYIIFRKPNFHYAEHLIINTYLSSPQTLFYIFFIPFLNYGGYVAILQVLPVVLYTTYAYKQVFEQSWGGALMRSLLLFVLYQFLFGLALLLLFGILVLLNS